MFEQKNTVQMNKFLLGYCTFVAQKSEWVSFKYQLQTPLNKYKVNSYSRSGKMNVLQLWSYWDLWLLITVFWQIWAQFEALSNLFWNSTETHERLWALFLRRSIWEAGEFSIACLGETIEVLKRSHLCSNACCRCACCQLVLLFNSLGLYTCQFSKLYVVYEQNFPAWMTKKVGKSFHTQHTHTHKYRVAFERTPCCWFGCSVLSRWYCLLE